ncbi:Gfo/Idh/MocA family protein [Synoicihabitans lomoniglobus]|uniref:Gfo/Idh/MocA family oxidoreductase n=1 Tax=Synoicihabitans lomoniglobus TaxID=2909285 RepID=A0AAE9ZWN3_9BACT|nr:Gfo/Idh/MocA family oxidoreductase [Opitutaceae bacterium LMO-M01]WED64255.1 Gfo/Idh/MocA family oxidoreductase [Opitutaceae bacterium LMO-M01]
MSNPSPSCPRVALIGVSGYGRIHLQLAQECQAQGQLRLVAAVVINPDEERVLVAELQEQGCAIYADYDAMFAAEDGALDLCMVPTGIHWHARMTIAALRHGANVLVEKPLCATRREADAIATAERETGRFVAVGFQDYYEPGTQWLKKELVRGAIGRVESVRFLGLWPRARRYFERNDWAGCLSLRGQPVYDSPLSNAFAHFVMLSLFFADPREEEVAAAEIADAELYRAHAIESFDTGVVRSRTAAGVELWFGASHASRATVEPLIEIKGSTGTACWSYESEAWLKNGDGQKRTHPLLDVNGARQHMMAAVLRRLQDQAHPVCAPRMATQHTAFVESLLDGATIENFDPSIVHWSATPDSTDAVPNVSGLEMAMRDAYAVSGLLSVAADGWTSQAAPSVDSPVI